MSSPRILISGASVAGPALAFWLNQAGWSATVVERFDQLRRTGHNIDIRGAAREVVQRMGIKDVLLASRSGEAGTEFLDTAGRSIAVFPRSATEVDGATAELEILRGELSRIIYETTEVTTEYLFGDQITDLHDTGDHVEVSFRSGTRRSFDVVVIADGLASRTRRLIMPDADISRVGLYTAYTTMPRTSEDNDYWRWYNATDSRVVMTRPDNFGTTRALLSFVSNVRGLEELPQPEITRLLRRTFSDAGWVAPRVLDALDDEPYYFDAIGQVRLSRWSVGRVGLVGDAAYCASPLSGMSTSLALVGAYVLAGELATNDPVTAFTRFEEKLRPYVAGAQQLPPGAPRLAHPRTRAGIGALHTVARVMGSSLAQKFAVFDRLSQTKADDFRLPDYFAPVTTTRARPSSARQSGAA